MASGNPYGIDAGDSFYIRDRDLTPADRLLYGLDDPDGVGRGGGFGLDVDTSRVFLPTEFGGDGPRPAWDEGGGSASWEEGYEDSGDNPWGYADGGMVQGEAPTRQTADGGSEVLADEEVLVQGAIMALDQESQMSMEDRKMIIQEFIETFGEEELKRLMMAIEAEEDERLGGGGVGPTDTVPAMLTPGEFVLPTDTMQQISNGKQIGREDLEQIQASAGRPAMGLGGVA